MAEKQWLSPLPVSLIPSRTKQFPKQAIKLEDGTLIPAVPRPNRLRTVIGMFYKDGDDKFKEISKLRDMIVLRDKELRISKPLC